MILCFSNEVVFSKEATIEADHIFHNHAENKIKAQGNVVITYQRKKLFADEIEYNLKDHQIYAVGHIELINEYNEVVKANMINVDDQLNTAYMQDMKVNFSQDAILHAKDAIKNFDRYELNQVYYTTCKFCNTVKPEWKLVAENAHYNNLQKRMYYKKGKLYLKNIPILYLPFLSHTTNIKEQKIGFLFPKYRSTNKGAISIPFYAPISSNKELIYTPTFFRAQNTLNDVVYNHLTSFGKYSINLSFIKPKISSYQPNTIEHFLKMHGKFNISSNWITGFDIEDTSDNSFRDKYYFSEKNDYLVKNLYTNYYNVLDYLTIDMISFQDLKGVKETSELPMALPLIELHKELDCDEYGKHIINMNYLKTYRDKGTDSGRLILSWQVLKTHKLNSGNIFDYSYNLRSDFYDYEDSITPKRSTKRFLSEASVKWRYPLIKYYKQGNIILEPVAKMSINAGKNKNHEIHSEDGENYELSHYNLFSESRYDGLDKIDNYSKFTYGIYSSFTQGQNECNFMLGQMFYFNHTPIIKDYYKTTKASDYLVKIDYQWKKLLSLRYKSKFDHKTLNNTTTESSIFVHLNRNWKIYSSFASFKNKHLDKLRFYKIGSSKNLDKKWQLTGEAAFSSSSKLKNDAGIKIIYYKLVSRYTSECSNLKFEIKREYPKNLLRYKKPHTKFSFEFRPKFN